MWEVKVLLDRVRIIAIKSTCFIEKASTLFFTCATCWFSISRKCGD